jgi:uncharacterized protein
MSDAPQTPTETERWTIAITGATGMIGSALSESLERDGHRVRRVVRSDPGPEDIEWDPAEGRIDAAALEGVDGVVHLAGEPVGERWTEERKRRIRESRVQGTTLLSETLATLADPPGVLVTASGVNVYGDRGGEVLDESSAPGSGFLAGVVREWETATEPAARAGIRVVNLRLAMVLSRRGGALAKMLPPFQLGGGGTLGSGRQWMSWISLHDAVMAFRFALANPELEGPVNAMAPDPVTNAEFTSALGRALGRPTFVSVPEFALRLLFGEMADETLLSSQRAIPHRLQAAGFRFRHPRLGGALRDVLDEHG